MRADWVAGWRGIRNLGWKLGQVLAGASEELLNSYEAERQPIAATVLAISTKKYEGIAKRDPASIRRGKDEKQLAISYRGGVLAPEGSAVTTTLAVGDRAPDAVLETLNGQPLRLFDAFAGPHFTLIAVGDSAAKEALRIKRPTAGAQLKRVLIDTPASFSAELSLKDAKGTLRKAYGLSSDTLVLVRPDGYIAHIATRNMADSTQLVINRMAPL
ncbi:FAD-dependent monooxygenase [Ectopseudomonas guguanensis]|uniref:aromatic-ring hydroxylase C-terminal domain-containing protein n=1 Tax=Ectopseudomonas guguanensis TaxID=1198456 RepID=UPI00257670D2|nr:FAD-dependent monooxygenase [Pseudomonas guguanensis]